MRILAIDSSGAAASCAVIEDGIVIGEYSINNKLTHSQKLMPMIDQLLKGLDFKPNNIDAYGCSIGPGSFTGLRIGISIVKGMAQALNKPAVGVSTLDGLAWNISGTSGYICPIIDARNDNVYTAVYQSSDTGPNLKSEYMAVNIKELIELLPKDKTITFVGDAVLKFKELLKENLYDICSIPPSHLLLPRASSVGYACCLLAAAGNLKSAYSLTPLYLRPSQAERIQSKNSI
ncbi:MAG: tRNA (adenosine(37)-N6)-threonylcarbamoyltransferase complex dimerization subunit type 1 TsaB [Deltaproteobacteria bacterium]